MTKKSMCKACGRPPCTARPVPLCSMCLMEAAVQATPDALRSVLNSLRAEAAAGRAGPALANVRAIPAENPKPPRSSVADADRIMAERLAALQATGVTRVTVRQFQDVPQITGRSRPWVYLWLDKRTEQGALIKDSSQDPVGYVFPE